jgi:hypothetical protein
MKRISLLLTVVLILLAGCTTSKITSSWKSPDAKNQYYKRILVLGLINEPDRQVREKMEQNVMTQLRSLGYEAMCSCEEFGPKTFENMNEQEALDKLQNSGIDAVLTIVLLDKQKERYYVPGKVNYTPYVMYQNRFYGYYRTMYTRVYDPGYFVENTKYFWESNFYSLDKKELIYSSQSQSFNPGDMQDLGEGYAKVIVRDIVSKNILSSQPILKGM